MKKLTTSLCLAGALGVTGATTASVAMAADGPHSVSANVGFVSQYVFRGISQTQEKPAIQGGFDYKHSSGLYLGTWGSNVSSDLYSGASMEWDVYGGYEGAITNDFSYNVGLLHYNYPGGNAGNGEKFNTTEAYGGVTWRWFNVKLSYALSDLFGINAKSGLGTADSDGSTYLEVNGNFELPQKFMLGLHVGDTRVKRHSNLNYTDYKISLSKEYAGFNWGVAYTDTDLSPDTIVKGKNLSDERFILSVSKSF